MIKGRDNNPERDEVKMKEKEKIETLKKTR